MRNITTAAAALAGAALLLSGCGGSNGPKDASALAKDLGCPNAQIQTKTQGNEPPRNERADCHGLTIVTFDSGDQQSAYLDVVSAAYKAFGGGEAILTGDDWALMGKKSALSAAQDKVGGDLK